MKLIHFFILPLMLVASISASGAYFDKKNEVMYEDDRKTLYTGKIVNYDRQTGIKVEEDNFVNGKRNGKRMLFWSATGKLRQNASYQNGKLDGQVTIFHRNGKQQHSSFYRVGKLDGQRTNWHENGQKEYSQFFHKGQKHGQFVEWDSTGLKRKEATYKNGMLEGKKLEWFFDGQKKSSEPHSEGKENGEINHWFSNGQKRLNVTMINGRKEGVRLEWYSNGKPESIIHYKNGEREGLWNTWYESGRKEEEGNNKLGKRDGIWVFWEDDKYGIKREEYYVSGVLSGALGPVTSGEIEWMQVSSLTNISYNEMAKFCNTMTGLCTSGKNNYGDPLYGWTWASSDDISGFFDHYIDASPDAEKIREARSDSFILYERQVKFQTQWVSKFFSEFTLTYEDNTKKSVGGYLRTENVNASGLNRFPYADVTRETDENAFAFNFGDRAKVMYHITSGDIEKETKSKNTGYWLYKKATR